MGHSRRAPHVRYQGTADIGMIPLDAKCQEQNRVLTDHQR